MVSQVSEYVPFLLTILISLLVFDQSLTITSQETGKALIAETCNKTEYPEDCISTLESDPRSFTSNVTGLTRIGLEITASKAFDSLSVAFYWLNQSTDYPSWANSLTCVHCYNDSVRSMEAGLKAFDELKYEISYQSLESVNGLANGCQKMGLEGMKEANTVMIKITKNFMAILDMLF